MLIDFGSTHNFIHCKLAKVLNCFVYPAPEFQVMIAYGGTINCSRKCHNINITMGEYVLNSPMIAIPMGGAYVVLVSTGYNHWEQWILIFKKIHEIFMGRKRIRVKGYQKKTKQGDKL